MYRLGSGAVRGGLVFELLRLRGAPPGARRGGLTIEVLGDRGLRLDLAERAHAVLERVDGVFRVVELLDPSLGRRFQRVEALLQLGGLRLVLLVLGVQLRRLPLAGSADDQNPRRVLAQLLRGSCVTLGLGLDGSQFVLVGACLHLLQFLAARLRPELRVLDHARGL